MPLSSFPRLCSFLVLTFLLNVTVFTPHAYAQPTARVTFIDSGAGDCILIRCPGSSANPKHILFDCGTNGKYYQNSAKNSQFEAIPGIDYASSIIKYFDDTIGSELHGAVVTHGDQDHYNILNAWLQAAKNQTPGTAVGSAGVQLSNNNITVNNLLLGGRFSNYPKEAIFNKKPFLNFVFENVGNRAQLTSESNAPEAFRRTLNLSPISMITNARFVKDAESVGAKSMTITCPKKESGSGTTKITESMEFTPIFTDGNTSFRDKGKDRNYRSAVYVATHTYTTISSKTPGGTLESKEDKTHIILTGDALDETVNQIIAKSNAVVSELIKDEDTVVLKVRHHGSDKQMYVEKDPAGTTRYPWLEMLQPDQFVFTGSGHFLHPTCEKAKHISAYLTVKSPDSKLEKSGMFSRNSKEKPVNCFEKVNVNPRTLNNTFQTYYLQGNAHNMKSTFTPGRNDIKLLHYKFGNHPWNEEYRDLMPDGLLKGSGYLNMCHHTEWEPLAANSHPTNTKVKERHINEKLGIVKENRKQAQKKYDALYKSLTNRRKSKLPVEAVVTKLLDPLSDLDKAYIATVQAEPALIFQANDDLIMRFAQEQKQIEDTRTEWINELADMKESYVSPQTAAPSHRKSIKTPTFADRVKKKAERQDKERKKKIAEFRRLRAACEPANNKFD